jgi:hypothetical protein
LVFCTKNNLATLISSFNPSFFFLSKFFM